MELMEDSEPQSSVYAPGRVNLIGEHTDYTGGLALPMAIQFGITVTARRVGARLRLSSDAQPEPLDVALPVASANLVEPQWGRYVAAVAAEMDFAEGLDGRITSSLPIAGLSSSAALELASALAMGFEGTALEAALLCQRAEHAGSGVPTGLMDQLACAAGVEGAAILMDCHTNEVTPVTLPAGAQFVVVHSGQARQLIGSPYAVRRQQCESAEREIGPLRTATQDDVRSVTDPKNKMRARHVVSENQRVRDFVQCLVSADLTSAGTLMDESHTSLASDFEVSTPILDDLVQDLRSVPGVHGARLTGAGFGGAVVALCEPGALNRGFVAIPSDGAISRLSAR